MSARSEQRKRRATVAFLLMLAIATGCILAWATSRTSQDSAAATRRETNGKTAAPTSGQGSRHSRKTNHAPKEPQLHGERLALENHLERFLRAYFLLKPDDTAKTIEARLQQVAPSKFVKQLGIVVDKTSLAGAQRVRHRIVITGSLLPQTVVSEKEGSHLWIVKAKVLMKFSKKGKVVTRYRRPTESEWRQDSTGWEITQLNDDAITF